MNVGMQFSQAEAYLTQGNTKMARKGAEIGGKRVDDITKE